MATGTETVGERAAPVGGDRAGRARPRTRGRVTLSLRNRLALVFSAITLVAIAALYLYVAPGLQSVCCDDQLAGLAADARAPLGRRSPGPSAATIRCRSCRRASNAAALATGDRVTLLLVNHVPRAPSCPSWPTRAAGRPRRRCRSRWPSGPRLGQRLHGHQETRPGPSPRRPTRSCFHGRVAAVIVYSSPASGIVRTVSTVRHQILVAGGIALLLALVGSYLVARALAQRVKRLELAAEQVAAGDFGQPIPVDSSDELGQLAVAFNADAAPACAARVGAQEVHRDRVARAAHPDLLAGRDSSSCSRMRISMLRRGGGSWSRFAIRSSGCGSCRSTCWICPGWSQGLWSCGSSRSTSAS